MRDNLEFDFSKIGEVEDEFSKSERYVRFILKNFPETRDSDKLVWLKYLEEFEGVTPETTWAEFREILLNKNTFTMATIIRVRAKLQEAGLYRGKKYEERKLRAQKVSDYMWEEKHGPFIQD